MVFKTLDEEIRELVETFYQHKVGIGKFLFCVVLSILVFTMLIDYTDWPRQSTYMAWIFTLAALCWVTESLPLFATSLLIIMLEIIFLANPGNWPYLGFENGVSPDYKSIISAAADPILLLFFGGFLMAQSAKNTGVDKKMASIVLSLFGKKPASVLLGLMVVTAFLSMWMSNTATAAMMIALVIPLLSQIKKTDPFRKAIVLAIPLGANIGGMGTPIGTPPNALAVSILAKNGIEVGFLEWMRFAIPLMSIILVFAWLILIYLFRSKDKDLNFEIPKSTVQIQGLFVIVISLMTILLWLTTNFHGIPSAVIALFPATIYTATGLLRRADLQNIEWDVLILIAGGIALGAGLSMSGLDKILIAYLPTNGMSVIFAFVIATVLLGTFMSHTAAANLILPIGISFALTLGDPQQATLMAYVIAFAASSAMALPISTPPNAIAYSKGEIKVKDMALTGILVGAFAIALFMLFLLGF